MGYCSAEWNLQVVVIASGSDLSLEEVNSQMRRIDLFCKLFSPLAVSLVDGSSTRVAIMSTFFLNAFSVIIEYAFIARVYNRVRALRSPSQPQTPQVHQQTAPSTTPQASKRLPCFRSDFQQLMQCIQLYTSHATFLPSLALSTLYFTVLSFSGQMVTYLLSAGYTSTTIGLMRSLNVLVEISATWIAPKAIAKIGSTRAGLWFLSWQTVCLSIAVGGFWSASSSKWAASALVAGVIASRIGLWGFDLCSQLIIQEVRIDVLCPHTPSSHGCVRKLSSTIAAHSPRSKLRSRISSNFAPLL